MSEQFNSNWPDVILNFDELVAAQDKGHIIPEVEVLVDEAGGMVPYLVGRMREVLDVMGRDDLAVDLGKEQAYRGSGAYQPIDIRDGKKSITEFCVTTELSGGVIPDSLVGLLFISDEGIQSQISQALVGGNK